MTLPQPKHKRLLAVSQQSQWDTSEPTTKLVPEPDPGASTRASA